MIHLEIGDRIVDSDPRSGARQGEVVSVASRFAVVKWTSGRTTRVARERVHVSPDRHTGYRRLPSQGGAR